VIANKLTLAVSKWPRRDNLTPDCAKTLRLTLQPIKNSDNFRFGFYALPKRETMEYMQEYN